MQLKMKEIEYWNDALQDDVQAYKKQTHYIENELDQMNENLAKILITDQENGIEYLSANLILKQKIVVLGNNLEKLSNIHKQVTLWKE